jgi:DNA-binding MarR family transcriptional regulator
MRSSIAPPQAVDPFARLVGYHLRRASAFAMADLAAELAPLGLRPAEASILFVIAANPGITQSGVGRTLGVARANMTPLIAGLAKRKLVARQAIDRRSHKLALTPGGRAAHDQAMRCVERHEARLFGPLPTQKRQRLIALLIALRGE